MYTIDAIPRGTERLSSEFTSQLVRIRDTLSVNVQTIPYYYNLDIDYSISSTLRTAAFTTMFRWLDAIKYNISETVTPYTEYYFHVLKRQISTADIDNEYYAGTNTFATRVLLDTDWDSTEELVYNKNIWTEMRAASLHLQETNRHKVRVLKCDNTLLVLTNRFTWTMFFKLKALECELFKDRCLTYNTDVTNVYKALATGDVDGFNKYINKIINYRTWAKYRIKQLKSCFANTKERRLKEKADIIEGITTEVNDYENYFKNALKRLEDAKDEYQMILTSEDKTDIEEVLEYLERHRFIKTIKKHNDNSIYLYIEAPLLYFDKEYIEDYRGFRHSGMTYVMKEVFLKDKYRMWTSSAISLDTSNFRTTTHGLDIYEIPYIPHPHLARYGCQGNHPSEIRKWLTNMDYIGCIEQIMAMVFNLNWTDGIVMSTMFDTINNHRDRKIFEVVETGEFVSFNDILAIKEEE